MHKEMLSVVYAKRVTMSFVRHLLVYSEKMMIDMKTTQVDNVARLSQKSVYIESL